MFSKRNVVNFLGGAVDDQQLAVAKELERTHLARMSNKTTARYQSSFALPRKCTHHGSRLQDF
jgi:hypothetical protein